jgi:hypothetical protein
MKPRVACPVGRADAAESVPSTPLRSDARMRMQSRVDAVHWRTSLHRVGTWMPPYLAHQHHVGIRTTPNSRALHVAPIAATHLRHVGAPSHYSRAEPSPPFLSPGATRVTPMQCMALKGGHPLHLVRASALVRLR